MALIGEMKYLTIGDSTYEIADSELPIASASTLGGIKVGTGLTIDSTTGILNATGTSITIDSALSSTSTNPVQNKVINSALAGKADTSAIPTKVSQLTNDSGYITGYTETDPVFSASPAAGITTADIEGWDAKVSDDKTWNGVTLNKSATAGYSGYIPFLSSTTSTTAQLRQMSDSPSSGRIAVYNSSNYLTSTTPSANDNSTKVATTAYVDSAITSLPEPMVFKGSLGTGGTITSLPTASSSNEGFTYKVITAGTYASQAAKVGDTFISDGSAWVLIPSGDEPSGTVTSVGVTNGGGLSVSGSPITSSGTITVSHGDTSSQASSSNSGRTYIQSVTLDDYGHVTGLSTATETVTNTDTKNTAGSTDTSSKIFLIGATTQAANPQTYSHDTAYVGTNGHLYSGSKEVLVGGSNSSSSVTITPSTINVYSMTSAGSVTAGTATTPAVIDTTKFSGGSYSHSGFSGGSFTRGSFSGGSLAMTMDSTDTKKLNITFTAATHGNDSFTAATYGTDSFTAASLGTGFYTAGTKGTPTAVTLPGRSSAIAAWTGYTAATAAAQTFTGATS